LSPREYVEDLNQARTPLADFFSILLSVRLRDGGKNRFEHRIGVEHGME
jgi:hypothetical protein